MIPAADSRKFFSPVTLVSILFIVLNIAGTLHHEMWLDELHHWCLGRDSNSIRELFFNARYDGHPLLWDGMLFVITRFTANPLWMQLLNALIACSIAILILRFAPFSLFIKTLIVFGYFLFYEYGIISRNYELGFLLIVCCCILYKNRSNHYLLLSFLMSLMANTHLLSLFVSLAFFIMLAVDYYFSKNSITTNKKLKAGIGALIYFLFVIGAVLQIVPPADSRISVSTENLWSFHRFGNSLSILTKGFFPLPNQELNWWNSNWFVSTSPIVNGALSVLILLMVFYFSSRKLLPFLLFYFTLIFTMIFIFLFQMSAVKYYGFVFISFLASLWIAQCYEDNSFFHPEKKQTNIFDRASWAFFVCILITQVIAGAVAYISDFNLPFSQAKNTAEYLRSSDLNHHDVAVSSCNVGPPISGYLDQKLFYPQINQWGTFCKWNLPFEKVSEDTILFNLKRLCRQSNVTVVMVLNNPVFGIDSSLNNKMIYKDSSVQIDFIKSFEGSIVPDENYYIYLMSPAYKER